jgi:hypothetical protein
MNVASTVTVVVLTVATSRLCTGGVEAAGLFKAAPEMPDAAWTGVPVRLGSVLTVKSLP